MIGYLAQGELVLLPFVFSFLLNFVLSRLAHRYGFLDIPFERKSHPFPVALGGGVALFLSLALSSMLFGVFQKVLIFSSLLVIMGLIDDLLDLPPLLKLFIQALVSGLWMLSSSFTWFGNPFIDFIGGTLWLLFLTNAFNIIDGIDGLASGIGVLASIGLIYKGEKGALLLLGACLGFFILNYPPAKIFLGDAGAYLLGFITGVLSLSILNAQTFSFKAGCGLFLILAFPLIETVWTVLRRWLKGQSPMEGDDRHIHHYLKKKFGNKFALFVLLLIQGISVLMGAWCF